MNSYSLQNINISSYSPGSLTGETSHIQCICLFRENLVLLQIFSLCLFLPDLSDASFFVSQGKNNVIKKCTHKVDLQLKYIQGCIKQEEAYIQRMEQKLKRKENAFREIKMSLVSKGERNLGEKIKSDSTGLRN